MASEKLERQLIITWVALERGDELISREYNNKAQDKWIGLRADLTARDLPKRIQHSVSLMNFWMLGLNNAINNELPQRACMNITLMQQELRTVRQQSGSPHPADALYDFYYSWKDVTEASNDPMLCLLEWGEYEDLVRQASKQWQTFNAGKPLYFDGVFPGYGTQSVAAENVGLLISQKLAEFEDLLRRADHTIAAAPSRELETLFFDYLAIITDYPKAENPANRQLK